MGFRPGCILNLQFTGEVEGAEVRIRSGTIQDMHILVEATEDEEVIDLLLKYAVSWNLEDAEGNVIPLEKEAICRDVDARTLIHIAEAWRRQSTRVSAPLEKSSTSGESSPEESIPTEVL